MQSQTDPGIGARSPHRRAETHACSCTVHSAPSGPAAGRSCAEARSPDSRLSIALTIGKMPRCRHRIAPRWSPEPGPPRIRPAIPPASREPSAGRTCAGRNPKYASRRPGLPSRRPMPTGCNPCKSAEAKHRPCAVPSPALRSRCRRSRCRSPDRSRDHGRSYHRSRSIPNPHPSGRRRSAEASS